MMCPNIAVIVSLIAGFNYLWINFHHMTCKQEMVEMDHDKMTLGPEYKIALT
jgi:hypothetical protein